MTPFLSAADHGHAVIEHFSLGPWLVVLSYAVAVAGSIVGLACARQSALAVDGAPRQRWLALAAVSIGGIGVWLMHFIAMLGMRVPDTIARYDLGWTAFSALLAIGATYLGLLMIGRTVQWARLVPAGIIMGVAVALMHYTGMMAVGIQGQMGYNMFLVALSVVIAVAAATVALWFSLTLRGKPARVAAGLVMGVAVVGMHYTGMAALHVDIDEAAPVPSGFDVFTFLFPVLILGLIALAVPITAIMLAPERPEEQVDGIDHEGAPSAEGTPEEPPTVVATPEKATV
ncbi:hypothetical protein JQN72_10370 [Phycicoccus sp. CSK15P-2]|uniref:MHYT domain-containing protein n=1 Tax=Phycicoccus sp. CSK15P-2 TaxID=2807627 RepID=UPI00194FE8DB|nr:MHYT domain-containing protein [Phycicoccus sp. CSK15P-2]MBM6404645.1 hypothetical protein [Phycicoccus sp. CSK15P-2]